MPCRRLWLLALAGLTTAASAPAAAAPALPPVDCVAAVRKARIARDDGNVAAGKTGLEAALALPGCEVPALAELVRLMIDDPASAPALPPLRGRLAALLSDPAISLPPGLLTQLGRVGVGTGPADREADLLLRDALDRRRERAKAGGSPAPEIIELLEVAIDLDFRLGREDAARSGIGELLVATPTPELRWRALMYDLGHARWASVLEQLQAIEKAGEASDTTRYYAVMALAQLGRFDEVVKRLDAMAPPLPEAGSAAAGGPGGAALGLHGNSAADPFPQARTASFVDLLLTAAWALRDAGRDADAGNLFRRALRYDSANAEAQAAVLHLYGSKEERAAAAEAADLRRQSETDPVALFDEASSLLDAGQNAQAFELLSRAAPQLNEGGHAEPAWYNLGTAASRLERWEDAVKAYDAAIAVNPARAESHLKRGVALSRLKRCPEAIPALRRALAIQPTKREAHVFLSACHRELGDQVAADREAALAKQ